VIEKQADANLTQDLASTLVEKFPGLIESLSLDKGFYSKQNKAFVERIIPKRALVNEILTTFSYIKRLICKVFVTIMSVK